MKVQLLRHFKAKDPLLARIVSISDQYDLSVSSQGSVFEALARSIANQPLSGVVARKSIERLVKKYSLDTRSMKVK